MKVRIKKAPEKMAYGGQKKHSLDIVRTTIDDYDPDYNDVERQNTRGADPREESTAEVEGGEVIVDKENKHVYKAVGPDHHPDPNKEGGVPMNLVEGSFVFSKRKGGEMGVKGKVLKNFGKSEGDKKTYSFAQLAEQYNPNKFYDAIVNGAGKLDPLTLNTYAANIQRYEHKLADLALLQESRKGFPQGIPDIAKEKFAKMQQYMQQAEQQLQQQEQEMPMGMYGYNMNYGGFVPDYSSVSDMYRYQGGGATGSQDKQIAQYIQAYAQLAKKSPEEIYQALQSLAPAQQQEALQNIVQTVQQVMSQQQGGGEEEQMSQDDSGYYSAPGGEPQYTMQQPSEEEAQQMKKGGSYSGTYYQGTYFADGGAFVPSYGDSSYNEQFGGQMVYDNDYGMLPKAQDGKQITNKVSKDEFDKKVASGEYVRIPGTNTAKSAKGKMITITEKAIPGQKGTSGASTQGGFTAGRTLQGGKTDLLFTLEDLKARPGQYKTFLEKEGWKNATPDEQKAALERLRRGRRSTYVPPKPATITEDGTPTCPPGFEYNKNTKNCEKTVESADRDYIGYDVPANVPQVPYAGPKPGEGKVGEFGHGYYGIPLESMLGIGAAAAYPPLYLRPFYAEPEAVIPRPTFYSPERELASAQETARGLEQMASVMNPQTAGSMASYIQANAAKTAADVLGRYNNLNVGVANQFSPLQAQIANSLLAQKRETKDKRFMGETVALQQYNNAMRQYATNLAKVTGEGMQAGKKLGQLYDTNPYYTTDAFGRLRLKPGVDATDAIMYGTSASRGSGLTPEQYLERATQLKNKYQGATDPMIKDAMNQYQKRSKSSRSASDDDDDLTTFRYGQSAYPFA